MVHEVLGYISVTKIWGWLPLDIVLHFLFGMVIMVTIHIYRKSLWQAFFTCLFIALLKEVYDSQSLVASWSEAIKDIIVTMLYPTTVIIVTTLKKKLDKE